MHILRLAASPDVTHFPGPVMVLDLDDETLDVSTGLFADWEYRKPMHLLRYLADQYQNPM